jgi:hypothetical protein
MKKEGVAGLFLSYKAIVIMAGFLRHPYQTMQDVVEKKVPMLFIFFPLVLCVAGWTVARFFSLFFLSLAPYIGLWWFLEVWWMSFWTLWQATLFYLYWRFAN